MCSYYVISEYCKKLHMMSVKYADVNVREETQVCVICAVLQSVPEERQGRNEDL